MYSHYCFILVSPAHIYYCHVIAHHCIEQMNMMMAVYICPLVGELRVAASGRGL